MTPGRTYTAEVRPREDGAYTVWIWSHPTHPDAPPSVPSTHRIDARAVRRAAHRWRCTRDEAVDRLARELLDAYREQQATDDGLRARRWEIQ